MSEPSYRMPEKQDLVAVIAGGGAGMRMNTDVPKQFLDLSGKPILCWSLDCFLGMSEVKEIILVVPADWETKTHEIIRPRKSNCPITVVTGGATRSDSVYKGLTSIKNTGAWVAVHDAARPGITQTLVRRVFSMALKYGGAACALASVDTVVEVDESLVVQTLDRKRVYRMQTPQIFPLADLIDAMHMARIDNVDGITDDSGLMMRYGYSVHVCEGAQSNIKITEPCDLDLVATMIGTEIVRG